MNWKVGCWVLVSIWLSACGNRGPLVLPDADSQKKRAAETAQSVLMDQLPGFSRINKG